MRLRTILAFLSLFLMVGPLAAVQPGEMLKDPALEARAREISKGLRCLVCQNESIDESNADVAHDLRMLVRERLTKGDSDEAVRQYLVDRYGEFVLLRPRFEWRTALTWILPFAIPPIVIAVIFFRLRRRPVAQPEPLSAAEEARLREIMDTDRTA